jgi:hypothetical protein
VDHSTLLKKASLVGAFFVSACLVSPAQAFCPLVDDLAAQRVAKVVDVTPCAWPTAAACA